MPRRGTGGLALAPEKMYFRREPLSKTTYGQRKEIYIAPCSAFKFSCVDCEGLSTSWGLAGVFMLGDLWNYLLGKIWSILVMSLQFRVVCLHKFNIDHSVKCVCYNMVILSTRTWRVQVSRCGVSTYVTGRVRSCS